MEPQIRYKEKSVIIHRDENGFGLRVGGQNPVLVDCVHENGAAWKAGVRKDDRIIKVNGTLVRSYDHQRVVHMIQNCTPFVNLTLHSPEQTIVDNSLTEFPNSASHLTHSQSSSSIANKARHNRNQSSTRDNPYYYCKTTLEKSPESKTNCNSILINQDQSSNRATSSLSIVRSQSSSKMSTRSNSSKYKSRDLRSRLVEDLRSLAITNSQATPSSLSTSPSSSDLSDCDDQDASRVDCLSISNSSSSSHINSNLANNNQTNSAKNTASRSNVIGSMNMRTKQTTRRLEIIKELVETEKAHTERLKQLNDLLYKPIKAESLVPVDQLKMIFSCHKTLFKIHRQIYKLLSAAQLNVTEAQPHPLVGEALVKIFEGDLGKKLERAASTFCACQATNTELLNRFTRKDTKAGEFLAQVANQQMIGRLGIKDLLASCFQRMTKYPLLLENLLKATPTCSKSILHSKSMSEGAIVTNQIHTAIRANEENELRGQQTNFEPLTTTTTVASTATTTTFITTNETTISNVDVPIAEAPISDQYSEQPESTSIEDGDFSSNIRVKEMTATTCATKESVDAIQTGTTNTFDEVYAYERYYISKALYQSRQILIHVNDAVNRAISHNKLRDIWKKTEKHPKLPPIEVESQQMIHEGPLTLRLAGRTFEVYVLLLTHYVVILTREGQDKYKLKYFTADPKIATQFSPIFNIDEHLSTRDTATDENCFYLLCKKKPDLRIYEFASQSSAERAKWKEKIDMAQSFNCASLPDDNNTLTRYTELISLSSSNNTPSNIESSTASTLGIITISGNAGGQTNNPTSETHANANE